MKNRSITVQGTEVGIATSHEQDYIALTDMVKSYLIKEFQRLKDEETRATSLEWSFQRMLAKVNYRIHTDAIKERLAQLNAIAITQMRSLVGMSAVKQLGTTPGR